MIMLTWYIPWYIRGAWVGMHRWVCVCMHVHDHWYILWYIVVYTIGVRVGVLPMITTPHNNLVTGGLVILVGGQYYGFAYYP